MKAIQSEAVEMSLRNAVAATFAAIEAIPEAASANEEATMIEAAMHPADDVAWEILWAACGRSDEHKALRALAKCWLAGEWEGSVH